MTFANKRFLLFWLSINSYSR